MTTTIKILAHCSSDKEVVVTIADELDRSTEQFVLQNGEAAERYVYDARKLCVCEVKKS